MSNGQTALKPRKSPRQARSAATLKVLQTAAIQVLTREGLSRCTTTRIAGRAGVSVGSLYQYYPNRDALLSATLEKHLDGVAGAVERACRELHGQGVASMASGLVTAFLAAKLGDPEESKALYAVAAERGGPDMVARMQTRMAEAVAAMLASAADARFDDPVTTSRIALGAMAGPVRGLLEGHVPVSFQPGLEPQLTRLLTAYFETHRVPAAS